MIFSIDKSVVEQFPAVVVGALSVRDLDNRASGEQAAQLLAQQATQTQQDLTDCELGEHPNILAWREAYRNFGSKPRDYPSSVESLAKRVRRDGSLSSISPLVDLYNVISLRYLLPVGGEDIDAMRGDLRLTLAEGDEKPVVVLGKEHAEAPYAGEVIYRDDIGTICRRWNWREVARSALTPETTNAVLVIEALGAQAQGSLDDALADLEQLVSKHCGGSITSGKLDVASPSMQL